MRSCNMTYICAFSVILAGCGTKPIQPSDQHIQREADQAVATTGIPETVKRGVVLPPPNPAAKVETYSVVVTNVPAQEILFALARDAKINLDIHPGIQGTVTVNAINQTLPQILTRIAKQVDMRYELNNGYLTVMPDSPYLHSYKIDYVNMSRDSDGSISNSSLVGTGAGRGGNSAALTIKNTSNNHFWETLRKNIEDILKETDKQLLVATQDCIREQNSSLSNDAAVFGNQSDNIAGTATGAAVSLSAQGNRASSNKSNQDQEEKQKSNCKSYQFKEAASVIASPEAGIITVRATGKQHEKIQEFIDQVMTSARRQVLIEATIVEVRLSDEYKQGIDWKQLRLKGINSTLNRSANLPTSTAGMFTLGYLNPTSKFGDLAANISLLESFGNVKVLSSPKLSVMNNQTAVLRVADNLVYFSMNVTPGTVNALTGTMSTPPTYTSTLQTSLVGFTMSLTPQINDSDTVLLNIRPSITRLLGYVNDPNPSLANPCLGVGTCTGVSNRIPQTSTREMESVLKIENNQTAVLGGLMEDRMDKLTDEVTGLASIPLLGNLFKNRNDKTEKTELVIFLRPVVIKDADLNGDFSAYRSNLPDQDFFKESASGKP